MELLQTALVITLLTITSAKPMRYRDHHDADIADKDWTQGLQDRSDWWLYQLRGYNLHDDSSESSETESSESSEEIIIEQTTAAETTAAETTVAETTAAETTTAVMTAIVEDGSTIAPEPNATPTDGPTTMETTRQPGTPTVPIDVTSPCVGGQCVIYEIPTVDPVTDNRGDN